ncbi:5-amino-6-(5-phosphoribosylamino)uracil reductase [Acuticoccus sediminis]|uniref:5-amino-6-(5-phosphoribosylamino)uracil reductase n=1 Tax=Acuticoccus sediminis TaxID=2184697 RepID=A0A8B2NHG6_9HYPH|nr:RibD family protein [Acuticoccus sediminis]RAH96772.1 5-amino-6-(5-phosphoribosylamino)uracil reductase [Acuticoccus sediminis]
MRPKITCHMITSLDGRLRPDRWSGPAGASMMDLVHRVYDDTAGQFEADGWIVGRKTMADYLGEIPDPVLLDAPSVRAPHVGSRGGRNLAVAIDPSGRLRFEDDNVDGDHAVVILSQRVPDSTLARLRERGVSYVFAGADGHDLADALEAVADALSVRHLILQGGAVINGSFLAAGLIDEVSTLIAPAIDGLSGIPAIFEHDGGPDSRPAAGQHLRLISSQTLEDGVIWLRHEVRRG